MKNKNIGTSTSESDIKKDINNQRLERLSSRANKPSSNHYEQHIQDTSIIKNFKRKTFQFMHEIEKNDQNFITTVEREQGLQFLRENNIENPDVSNILFPPSSMSKKVPTEKKKPVPTEVVNLDREIQLYEEQLTMQAIKEAFNDTEERCQEVERMWEEYQYDNDI